MRISDVENISLLDSSLDYVPQAAAYFGCAVAGLLGAIREAIHAGNPQKQSNNAIDWISDTFCRAFV
jgi:hypothetical protein